jgi:hypothetical protein
VIIAYRLVLSDLLRYLLILSCRPSTDCIGAARPANGYAFVISAISTLTSSTRYIVVLHKQAKKSARRMNTRLQQQLLLAHLTHTPTLIVTLILVPTTLKMRRTTRLVLRMNDWTQENEEIWSFPVVF